MKKRKNFHHSKLKKQIRIISKEKQEVIELKGIRYLKIFLNSVIKLKNKLVLLYLEYYKSEGKKNVH